MHKSIAFATAGLLALAGAAAAQVMRPGTPVLASPSKSQSGWKACTYVAGPAENDDYVVNCAPAGMKAANISVPGEWVKGAEDKAAPPAPAKAAPARAPAAPAVALAKPAPAPAPAPKAAAGAAAGLPVGEYACYGSGGRILIGLGFKVTAPGRYTDLDGMNPGTYSVAGDKVNFPSGIFMGEQGRNLQNGRFVVGTLATCEPFK